MVKDSCIDPTNAAIYANFDGIDGESKDDDHYKWIEVLAFGFDMHKPMDAMTGTSRRRGDVVLEDIKLVKKIDKATPKLQEAVAMGKVFTSVTIRFTKNLASNEDVYLEYELKKVMVTSYLNTVDTCGVVQDVLTLNFEEVKVTYTEYAEDGGSKGRVEWTWKVEEAES
jgi:type VI secretion system secreted protein Hcp